MALLVRGGLEKDYDPNKLLPREFAVSTDKKYVRICVQPGIVIRLATYEAFESDMEQIITILAECKNIQSAIQRIQSEVNAKASITIEYANAAAESAEKAAESEAKAKMYAENAEAVTGVGIASQTKAGVIKGGENYIDESGELQLTKRTTSPTLSNSYAGGVKINEIGGVSEQDGEQTPEAPVEIESVVIEEIKTVGKNFLNNTNNNQTKLGITFTVNEDKSVTVSGTSTANVYLYFACDLLTEGDYVLSGCPSGGNFDTSYSLFARVNTGTTERWYKDTGTGIKVSIKNSDTMLQCGIKITSGSTIPNLTFYPMIRKADIDDATYEPYQKSVITLSNPITLHGIGDVRDSIVWKDGVRKNNRKFAVALLDGSDDENIVINTSKSNYFRIAISERLASAYSPVLCSHYKQIRYVNVDSNNYGMVISAQLNFKDKDCATLAEFKAKLQSSPMTVLYELAEPTYEDLPTADQIALHSLKSFDTVTYISTDSEIEPVIDLEYGTSKVGGYSLDAWNTAKRTEIALADLTSAVLALNQE